jgi:hypothetical protein
MRCVGAFKLIAVVLLWWLSLPALHVAAGVRELCATYLISHFRQAFPACHSPNGWSG